MLKVKHKPCPEITGEVFMEKTNNQYNLRNRPGFITPQVHSIFYGTESISYLGPKIWDIFPEEFKNSKSLSSFKESIKM